MNQSGENALAMYLEAMKAIKARDFDVAEEIAAQMWLEWDARSVRRKIAEAMACE